MVEGEAVASGAASRGLLARAVNTVSIGSFPLVALALEVVSSYLRMSCGL